MSREEDIVRAPAQGCRARHGGSWSAVGLNLDLLTPAECRSKPLSAFFSQDAMTDGCRNIRNLRKIE